MYETILMTKPDLKIIDKNKLQITRRPSLTSWLLLFLSVVAFFQIFRRLTDNYFLMIVSISGQILFGLDTLGEWQDFSLDKLEKKATITRSNWSDKLIMKKTKNTTMALDEIRHVGVSINIGLFILCRDGKIFRLDTRGLKREEIQNHRKEINCFLDMDDTLLSNKLRLDSYEKLIPISGSEEEERDKKISQSVASSDEIISIENNYSHDSSLPKKNISQEHPEITTPGEP